MNYNSTRSKNTVVSASQAIAQGISEEGGLFVPQSLPRYSDEDIKALAAADYRGRAKKIFGDFLGDFLNMSLDGIINYNRFAHTTYLHFLTFVAWSFRILVEIL